MTQFHEDQEVEVWCFPDGEWRKAKIVHDEAYNRKWHDWVVQFPDGTRAVFDTEHIRSVNLLVSSNEPMGTRPANKREIDKWWLADMAAEWDEKLQAEGKP